jgi:pimeloyl-ACP methyl ester carboxylesterase
MGDAARPELGRSVDAAGVRTNLLEAGDGPPVVLVHGSGHVFGRCGHWTQIEWAEESNALLVRFLGRPAR